MKKFDWFTILSAIAITENTIFMIAQGSWWILVGLMFGGLWVWLAYWDWKNRRIAASLDTASRNADIQAMSSVFLRIGRAGVTIDEFCSALNNACQKPHSIGDVTCKWNARSPYIRCAINPSGECQECKDYDKL